MIEILKNKTQFVSHVIHVAKTHDMRMPKREVECIYYLIHGMTIKQIGRALTLSPRTVESYISSLKNRLNCYSRRELIEKVFEKLF